ncbi:MAG: aminopeptidase [Candidatus Gallimonas sp.]
MRGYETMTKEDLDKIGINDSVIHVDFMIGTKDLEVIGITKNGARVPVFKAGNWAF